jgi:hypothetical protein
MQEEELELAGRQYGVVSSRQLRALGVGPHGFAERAAGRHWTSLSDEVLLRVGAPRGRGADALAAVLDSGAGSVLSHSSAASWWGSASASLKPVHTTRTSRGSRGSELAVVHTIRWMEPAWCTVLDAVPVVLPPFLALQLFAQLRYERAERWVESMWSRRLLSGPQLRSFLDEVSARGRDGCGGLRRYLDARGPDYVPAASSLELRARSVLSDAGIAVRPEVDLGADDWSARVDLLHATLPLVVEIQSERYHSALVDAQADDARRARLEADGFVVVEVWDSQVWHRPWEMVAAVRDGERRARAGSVRQR